ncbi:LytTR family transcriptional regulator DNA-binding domain-containing protein [Loktanella sp. F6476L]|uniref:MHYT domain-containing protein n=1 Tax=Loktanella sp. F6476L TaxID=2926405 RepID=UPI001FF5D5D3|nr:MHYT domain-containing protein [Loktanella sp. F6476L]MCK0119544.1 LytTR family transcriptional regulator DNA-binding domain-containing protein [Loktanella sp. F6476L]
METLSFSHDLFLVIMSCLVATAAAFTGLSLTRNLSQKSLTQKKVSVALAAIALGGGIWSMHFVAMLGLQLPVLFYYDAAITLISALTAILIVGAALILLHFTDRTPLVIGTAGAIVGVGILVMHYIGMAGLELCRAIYTPLGIAETSIVAIVLCILAFRVAYGHRTNRNIFLGTLCFAVAVGSVHFLAMAGTEFVAVPQVAEFGPSMSNEVLALGVIVSSFVIFGGFLWVSTTYLVASPVAEGINPVDDADIQTPVGLQIPCERDGGKIFVAPSDVVFVRADGHYTQIYTEQDRLFCVWPITEATKRLLPAGFIQTHRSYLVNPSKVARFERSKDKGRCLFDTDTIPPAPVSRSKLKATQDALLA